MPRQVDPVLVDIELLRGNRQHFERIHPPPVFPGEPVRPPVGRGDHDSPLLGGVGIGLVECLDTRAVERQEERRALPESCGILRGDRVVLHAPSMSLTNVSRRTSSGPTTRSVSVTVSTAALLPDALLTSSRRTGIFPFSLRAAVLILNASFRTPMAGTTGTSTVSPFPPATRQIRAYP